MASQMKNAPATIIMRLPVVALAKPVYVRNSLKLLEMKSINPIAFCFYGYKVLRVVGLCGMYEYAAVRLCNASF